MTHHILHAGGVVGDFHGDAAMGFWGWPINDQQAIYQACTGGAGHSHGVRSQLESTRPRFGWFSALVIGIASGPAVAGRIGTIDQVKVTVFGPVVNHGFAAGRHDQAVANFDLDRRSDRRLDSQNVPRNVLRVRAVARFDLTNANIAHGQRTVPPGASRWSPDRSHLEAYERLWIISWLAAGPKRSDICTWSPQRIKSKIF